MGDDKTNCQHEKWICAGYPYEKYEKGVIRISSIYEVYCKECNNFVNLLTKDIVNNEGLVKMEENNG